MILHDRCGALQPPLLPVPRQPDLDLPRLSCSSGTVASVSTKLGRDRYSTCLELVNPWALNWICL